MSPIALVTGASGAIGEAIARQLAEKRFDVVLGCRDRAKADGTAARIAQRVGARPRVALFDQARPGSIRELAERWTGPLSVLVVNASDTPRRRSETEDGVEVQWATNVLGYARLVRALLPVLERSAPSRVVFVASHWAGGLDLSDAEFEKRPYDNDTAYRQSKQAERMLAAGLAPRLVAAGVAINACHPGDVNSALSNSLGFGGHQSPDQGADTPVWLASDPDLEGKTGLWFSGRREEVCPFSRCRSEVEVLLALVERYE